MAHIAAKSHGFCEEEIKSDSIIKKGVVIAAPIVFIKFKDTSAYPEVRHKLAPGHKMIKSVQAIR